MIKLQLQEFLTHAYHDMSSCTCEQLILNNVPHDAYFTFSVLLIQAIHSVGWHHEGKQFMCSHSDGSLTMWNLRNTTKPIQINFPHGEDLKIVDLSNAKSKQTKKTLKSNFLFGRLRFLSNGFSSCNAVQEAGGCIITEADLLRLLPWWLDAAVGRHRICCVGMSHCEQEEDW